MQYLEDAHPYFDVKFSQIWNLNLEYADSYSGISFMKFQT